MAKPLLDPQTTGYLIGILGSLVDQGFTPKLVQKNINLDLFNPLVKYLHIIFLEWCLFPITDNRK